MPRDANGNYTLPSGNPVVADTLITIGWANPTMADIAQQITNSLSRNGQGGMLAPFKNADGIITAPGISWTNAPNSGWRRATTNDFRYVVNSVDVLRITPTGPAVLKAGEWKPLTYLDGPNTVPVGSGANQLLLWNATTQKWVSGTLDQLPDYPSPQNGDYVMVQPAAGGSSLSRTFFASMVGPQGPQGVQGIQGPIGLTGPQGADGADGPDRKSVV